MPGGPSPGLFCRQWGPQLPGSMALQVTAKWLVRKDGGEPRGGEKAHQGNYSVGGSFRPQFAY